ncbi:deaminase domain-containing protein [Priestia flexa]|uniref:deaminase domain-containing protein n=1 Tax=Priestia flexa TaxID=86664 RepID=UPI00240DE438|nr:deaminase domain-containing protein [Priestia flexa]WEZ06982.1 deaminase domain-containing protein [Priestia flexa]
MGKIYDAKGISTFSKEREKAYKNLEDQLQTLHKALAAVSKLDDSLQGKGADNIKKFYEYQVDNAKCWIDLVQMTKSYFSALYVKAEDANLAGNTVVDLSFLEHDLKQSVSQAKELVAQQREDLQTILHKVDDLVSLSAFSAEDFNDSIDKAEKKRDETVEAVEKLDAEWLEGYRQMESNYLLTQAATNSLHGATTQGGQAYPVLFDQKAYHASELYKVQKEASEYATNYVTYHEEMKNVHELKKEAERQAVEEANKKWYEKTWDTVSTFTGEVTGYYDYKRAAEGVDPVTGRELSTSERVAAGAMAAAGFIPVVGWAGRAAKGGKAIYVTAKGVNAADHALDAYKTSKSFKALEQAEKGLYGLVAANGMYEFTTGKDMFGNAISEEQRQNSLFQSLGIAGAGALSTRYAANMGQAVVTKGTEKLTQMRNTLRTSTVANITKQAYHSVKTAPASWTQSLHKTYMSILDSTMPRFMPERAPAGPALAQQTVRETLQNVKQQAMQMITPIYNPKVKRYQDPETGRFVANPNVERVEKPVGVEKKGKEDESVRSVERGQAVSKVKGKVYPTRQINSVTEAHIIDRVKELRGNLTSRYKKSGNFAVAEVDVSGLSKSEFYAQSSINELKGNLEHKVPDISLQPENPMFKATEAVGKEGESYLRNTDTEYKILNDIASRLGENTQATGKIKLFTELDTCDSCSKVIAEFAAKYKNIELEVIHNNGNRIIP